MKKLFLLMISVLLALTLVGCGHEYDEYLSSGSGANFSENMIIEFRIILRDHKDLSPIEVIQELANSTIVTFDSGYGEYNQDNKFGTKTIEDYNDVEYQSGAYLYSKNDDISVIAYVFELNDNVNSGIFADHFVATVDTNWNPKHQLVSAVYDTMGNKILLVFVSDNVK